jgi:hypothetical protein
VGAVGDECRACGADEDASQAAAAAAAACSGRAVAGSGPGERGCSMGRGQVQAGGWRVEWREQQAGRAGAHAERQPRARLGGTARDGTR